MENKKQKIPQPRIMDVLERFPIITANKFAKELEIHYRTAWNYLEELRMEGYLVKREWKVKNYTIHIWEKYTKNEEGA